ncbi:hypothetical protein FGO68_gene12020 [Halteria grandinella]|uniref:Uncharacterized protein n=1 Tax=Halteria grandinella TaxID=5974 RepID=A0A8J8P0W8_HALGN|nr:hypothetical protein FGO68_gene12020 [Halteria grandinella]
MAQYKSFSNQTIWWVGKRSVTNLWSPEYWNQTVYSSAGGFFFNSTSAKWQFAYWTYYDSDDYYYLLNNENSSSDANATHSNSSSINGNHTYDNEATKNNSNPNFNYANKNGPRQYKYDSAQGGKITYKQDDQSTASGAIKSNPFEPICKGRNQIIIVGDPRILDSVYSNGRRLAVVQTTAEEKTVSVKMETVAFISDGIASNAILFSVKAILLSALAVAAIMF